MSELKDSRRSRSTLWRQAAAELSRAWGTAEQDLESDCSNEVVRNVLANELDEECATEFVSSFETDHDAVMVDDLDELEAKWSCMANSASREDQFVAYIVCSEKC